MFNWSIVEEIIKIGFKEDINNMDVTTDNLIDDKHKSSAYLIAKVDGVIAGVDVFKRVFELLDDSIHVEFSCNDGDYLTSGTKFGYIQGNTKTILKGERLALNLLQRMSGIATKSRKYYEILKDYPVKIVDTRKTTPGLRILEKYSVRIGGCHNHRFNLSEAVMIKDNHIKAVGSITEAVKRAKNANSHTMKIEIEVETLDELAEAIDTGVDIVMLDNMSIEDMKKAVAFGKNKVILEASGGVTIDRLVEIGKTGVDIISVGGLTHSIESMDISLNIF